VASIFGPSCSEKIRQCTDAELWWYDDAARHQAPVETRLECPLRSRGRIHGSWFHVPLERSTGRGWSWTEVAHGVTSADRVLLTLSTYTSLIILILYYINMYEFNYIDNTTTSTKDQWPGQPTFPPRPLSLHTKKNPEETAERNMKNLRTKTHTSFILAKFWIWWGPWLIAGPLSLTPLTVWPLAGLQQPHSLEREQAQPCTPRYFYATTIHTSGLVDQLSVCWLAYPEARLCYPEARLN